MGAASSQLRKDVSSFLQGKEDELVYVMVHCQPLAGDNLPGAMYTAIPMLKSPSKIYTHFSLEFYYQRGDEYAFTLEKSKWSGVQFSTKTPKRSFLYAPGFPPSISLRQMERYLFTPDGSEPCWNGPADARYSLTSKNCQDFCHRFWLAAHQMAGTLGQIDPKLQAADRFAKEVQMLYTNDGGKPGRL